MSTETVSVSSELAVSSEFDIFARKPIQMSILENVETVYKHIAPVCQSDLEFLTLADNDNYIKLDIKFYIRSKLITGEVKNLDATHFTDVTNNFLHSLFSQCIITLNGVPITQAGELYQYRSYLETLKAYRSNAANTSHNVILVSRQR